MTFNCIFPLDMHSNFKQKDSDVRKVKKTATWLMFLLAYCSGLQAGDGTRISLVEPFFDAGSLHVVVRSENIFNPKISGTINSGLPCLVEVQVELYDHRGRVVRRLVQPFRISYNIWEEKYQLESPDSTVIFTDFSRLRKHFTLFRSAGIVAQAGLKPSQSYRLRVRIGVAPISSRQSRKLSGWLDSSGKKDQDDITSEEQSSGFRVNVSLLVSWFLGNSKKHTHYSPWFVRAFQTADIIRTTLESK